MKQMSLIKTILVLLTAAAPALAQEPLELRAAQDRFKPMLGTVKLDSTHQYDVLKYRLAVDLPMTNDSLYGHQDILAIRKTTGDSLTLNCVRLEVDSVKLDGSHTGYSLSADTLFLTADFASVGVGQSFNLEVFYRGGNFSKNGVWSNGYYWFKQGVARGTSTDTLHTLGYTMSEPQDARAWMPCFDEPWDKADSGCSISITLPDSFAAASNGLLQDTLRSGDRLTWRWQEDSAIATYLMCFTASRYAMWSDTAHLASGRAVPLNYFIWPEDSALSRIVFATVPGITSLYDSLFHDYPFCKYGMAVVYPVYFGGMEHQTMTTISRSWLLGNVQKGVVHELAHMWYGDLVTCGTWPDIWLNEGFASYLEAVHYEWETDSLPGNYMNRWFWRALSGTANLYPIYNPPENLWFDYPLVYNKGAWVLHGLRWVMGDTAFFPMMRAYADSFANGNAITTDFQRIGEQHHSSSLQWFFDQWVYRAGHPIYSTAIYYKTQGDSNSAWVKLRQTSTTGELYKMPLALACSTSAGFDSVTVVWDSLTSQDFLVYDDQPVAGIKLDPDSWVLKEWNDSLPHLTGFLVPIKRDKGAIVPCWNRFTADTTIAGYNLYRSADSAGPFTRINAAIITDTVYFDGPLNNGDVFFYCITAVNGVDTCYETHFSNILSGMAEDGVEGTPGEGEPVTGLGLTQAAPNPFKQSTVINYQLTRPGLAAIKVYNVQGQLVKTLVNAVKPAGRHQAQWNGRDETGNRTSSGIYFARLEAEGRTITRTLQYVK
ncbi:T9SS type A sorting domain-containing protein [candidate division TA06 bacterium]|nr:T9SS type A sorting domain-containing protein [candidate division TA06 bacterium]